MRDNHDEEMEQVYHGYMSYLYEFDDLDWDISRLSVNSDAQPKQKQLLRSPRSGLLAKAESRRRKNSKRFNNRDI